ncbi:calcium channel protein CCH1 [Sporobolomyces koalae]|uniref:calcium channel protein CCH1 n=1 Tax=Sporobolomyces koalae TaxID=500713 RepID=UPI00317495B4
MTGGDNRLGSESLQRDLSNASAVSSTSSTSFLSSDDARTRTSSSGSNRQRRPPPIDTSYAATTAHQRPISPISLGTSDPREDLDPVSVLHRRSSSRRRSPDRSATDTERGEHVGGEHPEYEGAVPSRQYAEQSGWHHVVGSPASSPTKRERRPSPPAPEDGFIVRQLPALPQTSPRIPSFPASSREDDPFYASTASTGTLPTFDAVAFDESYRSSRGSHPLALDGASFGGSSSDSEDGDHTAPSIVRNAASDGREREAEEEIDLHSPLHPSASTPPSRRPRLSVRTPRLSPLFPNAGTSSNRLSPNPNRTDPRTSPVEGRGRPSEIGWQPLSPSRSPSRSPRLARRETLTAAIGTLRRASVRVVNIAGADSDRLAHVDDHPVPSRPTSLRRQSHVSSRTGRSDDVDQLSLPVEEEVVEQAGRTSYEDRWHKEYEKYETSFRKLRGKTLYLFGPENKFRRFCARILTAKWTEPIILLLIIVAMVMQTIESSYNVHTHPRPTSGYFKRWEDYVLFVVFCCFTVELVSRIIVTGLVVNPPRPPMPRPASLRDNDSAFKRTPSLASRIEERLSPLPSPMRASPPLLPTQLKGTDSYPPRPIDPPDISSDITSIFKSYSLDPKNSSSTSLMRADSRFLAPTQEASGIGLGFSKENNGHPDPQRSQTLPTIKAALATSLSAASVAALPPNSSSPSAPYVLAIRKQRATYQQAFLRHSWNRIDAVAVVSFWVSFALAVSGREARDNLWFFRALSVLRATRLLAVTSGTQTILQSLKKASPLLVRTAFFIAFSMLIFSIIGLQSFGGSYQRYCLWIDPEGNLPNVTSEQNCGGHITAAGDQVSYILRAGFGAGEDPKGFMCAAPSICTELENPWGGARSFDNIFASLLQVVVLASANTWTGAMYAMMDADYYVSALFFIFGLVIINYWFINLFTAVITTTFADIRDETKHSAFAAVPANPRLQQYDDDRKIRRGFTRSTSFVKMLYERTRLIWVAVVALSVAVLAARQPDTSPQTFQVLNSIEIGCLIAFDVEIGIRIFASLPDWRSFFAGPANLTDTALAILSTVTLIPIIRQSPAYPWLTVFAIARFYRFILAIPRMRRLLTKVLGTLAGLINMIGFLFLMTFLMALIGAQMFRGIPDPDSSDTGTLDFYQTFNSFLAMYQILSSENWTDILNTVLSSEKGRLQIVLAAVFLSSWMFFGYFVIGNLFIAVINENFAIAEEEKKARQLETFINRTAVPGHNVTSTWLRRFDPYNYASARSKSTVSRGDLAAEQPVTTEIVTSPDALQTEFDFDVDKVWPFSLPRHVEDPHPVLIVSQWLKDSPTSSTAPPQKRTLKFRSGLESLSHARSRMPSLDVLGYHQRQPTAGTSTPVPRPQTREATIQEHAKFESVAQERKNTIREYIEENPAYDKTLYIFSQSSKVRQFCQRLVEPSYGEERLRGRAATRSWKYAFDAVVLVAIIVSIAVAAVATPLYRRNMFVMEGDPRWNWPNLVEVAVGFVFVLEFVVKIVADGFLFSPNAYLLSLWNDIDFLVLLTLLVNIITSLVGGAASTRFTRSLKAFRALRLINLWPTMRITFYNVLILGFARILDASILAVLYIVPFAVWGMQIFGGLLYSCNDSSVSTREQCVGEYLASPVADWTFMAPRVWSNPYVWSFDNFRSALLILFEIISLEGWIDVMESVMQITDRDQQPQENASQFNALFFVLYNAIGATFILTIFLSVIIDNLHRRSATALLTTEQRQWLDLRRLISRQRPSKRPPRRPRASWRAWCFDRAANKHGWWSRTLTGLYIFNIIVLMTEATTTSAADQARGESLK